MPHDSRSCKRAFSLVELLVVLAIVVVLIAMLLPALSRAKEASRRVACASQLRQFHLGLEIYADSYEEWYPLNLSGIYVHNMRDRPAFRDEYLGGNNHVFYCPSGTYRFDTLNRDSHRSRTQNYMSYWYLGGFGDYERNGVPRTSDGWRIRWSESGRRIAPTLRRIDGARTANAHRRPLVLDAAGNGKSWVRQESGSELAFPGSNHALRFVNLPDFENIMFVDGHLEGIGEPTQYPLRIRTDRNGDLHYP